jgi:hypothetical protein
MQKEKSSLKKAIYEYVAKFLALYRRPRVEQEAYEFPDFLKPDRQVPPGLQPKGDPNALDGMIRFHYADGEVLLLRNGNKIDGRRKK